MSDARSIVQEFCDRVAERDAEALRPLLADDVVYQNVGMAPAFGVDAVVESLASMFAMLPCLEFKTVTTVAEGDVVMNERLDMVPAPDGTTVGLPVMGTFVVRDGKIARWTDYWDSGLLGKLMAGEDTTDLVARYE